MHQDQDRIKHVHVHDTLDLVEIPLFPQHEHANNYVEQVHSEEGHFQ